MENNFEQMGTKEMLPAVGFIKSRKAECELMDMAEKMIEKAAEMGFSILEVHADRTGSRHIDRPALDSVHMCMEKPDIHDLFIRSLTDISDKSSEQQAFLQIACDNDVTIHVVCVEPEQIKEVWDGGAGY